MSRRRAVDEDASHAGRGDGEEVGAVLPADAGLVDEPEVGLVDEGGGLEGVAAAFLAHVGVGELSELVVDEGEEVAGGGAVAVADADEQAGEFLPCRRRGHLRAPLAKKIGRR